jgi:hypothetical protein
MTAAVETDATILMDTTVFLETLSAPRGTTFAKEASAMTLKLPLVSLLLALALVILTTPPRMPFVERTL